MIKHIVMWDVGGESATEREANIRALQAQFESLRDQIPGMRVLEIGVDISGVDYACHVVLYSEFESRAHLEAYANHPAHLKVRAALGAMRIARHQVDYEPASRAGNFSLSRAADLM
ncbi:Dabb family protein [Variovorax robiniae]|uniref:Dabb family protein n=1 Tax=Variovorax robiniae TaxID=1836199 RepID=A0ABU8XEA7_9BURK